MVKSQDLFSTLSSRHDLAMHGGYMNEEAQAYLGSHFVKEQVTNK